MTTLRFATCFKCCSSKRDMRLSRPATSVRQSRNGEMFLREFRRRWRTEDVPVILLSASSARNEIARRLGVEATLSKPFFAEDLRELVGRLVADRSSVAVS